MASRSVKSGPLAYARGSVWALCAVAAGLAGCNRHDTARAERSVRQIQTDLRGGQLNQALSLARSSADVWADRRGSDIYVRFRLLETDVLLNKGGQARAANSILSNLQVPHGAWESEIRRQTLLGRSWMALRKYDLAGVSLKSACELAVAQGLKKPLLEARLVQGVLLTRQRKFEESESTLRAALNLADELNDQSQRMAAFVDLGFNRVTQFHYDGAIPYFEKALIAGQSGADRQPLAVALGNLAICQYRLGDFENATRNVKQAISIQEAIGSEGNLINSYGELANINVLQRQYPRAIASYEQALGLAVKLRSDPQMEMMAVNLASAYVAQQDWDKAGKLNQQARAIADRIDDRELRPDLLLNSAAIEAGRGHGREAVRLYSELLATAGVTANNTWEAHAGLAHLYAQTGEKKQAAEHFEQAVQAIEQTRANLSRDEYKLTFLDRLIRFHQDYVDFLIDQGDNVKALEVADSSRALVLADGLGGERGADFQAVAKASHTILLSYWITPGRSVAWVITPGETRMETLSESGAKIQNLVEQYGAEVAHGIGDPARSGSAAGLKLYQVLVQPFRQFIPAGTNVIVVPDGPLHNLNFETLLMPGRLPAVNPRYWIDDVTLSVAPSLALLAKKDVDRTRGRGVLLIGDPEPNQQYP
ncbi:MAG: tetratricopeptide repeat protein, partial [Acidobacteriota bacterium]|nr:tetratricopeptide repeat protein [Acidobacteriota bacterium]